ncbi:MAG: ABC transporter ATP-binding protein/permease [Holophagales bacterium]|nr:ABC transporter ATP-binding protein/permease [Holophagales bacterium]
MNIQGGKWVPWWWELISPYKRMLALGLFATVVCGIAASWVPYWSGEAVRAIEDGAYPLSRQNLLWMLLVTLIAGVGRYFMRNILIGLSRQIERAQREKIFEFLLRRPFSFYERQTTGDLMSRIGDDVSTVRMATGPGLMSLLQTASILPMTLILMIHTDLRVTLAVLIPFALLPCCYYFLGRWSHTNQQKLQLSSSALTTFSHETISGEKVVQAFGLENIRVESFTALSREQARLNVLQTALFSSYGPIAAIMGGLSVIVLIWYGGAIVLNGRLGIGDLTAFTGYLAALGWPVMSVGWAANLFQRGKAGQLRIRHLLAALETAVPPLELGEEQAGSGEQGADSPAEIQTTNLGIRFESGRGLGPISISIPSGGRLAVVGGVGSGKTLLLQVLAGLRQPKSGVLNVNKLPMNNERLRSHWASLGWAPQEAVLFSGSLRENLTLGRPDALDDDLWEAARTVCLDELIKRLPDGLDTVVGERGVILSGGERQRTALARALLRKPGLLLMDDSLSAVDAETESRILSNLRTYLGKTTLILATHRVFVAELCEQVIVLDNGKLIQSGSPGELSNASGPYARIRALQELARPIHI